MRVETVHVQTRQPRNDEDPGECAIVHFTVADNVLKVTDKDGNMLRYPDGEPCKQVLGPTTTPDRSPPDLRAATAVNMAAGDSGATSRPERVCQYEHQRSCQLC
jgi:hypothetical protein